MTTSILQYIDKPEIDRLLNTSGARRSEMLAAICRINCLYMIQYAGSGHLGTSFSSMDILCRLYLEELADDDLFFSSKGHDAPGIYSVLIALGRLDFDLLHRLRRLGGLPGHPDVHTPCMVTNTGSLGMGISKARGMAKARRLDGKAGRVVFLMGDGELQEGQVYESLQPTVNGGYGELTAIVDHNKIQSDTWVADVSDLGDLEAKFSAFGWRVDRCNGNDDRSLAAALDRVRDAGDKPSIIVADTVKGAGVSFMEDYDAEGTGGCYAYHSGALPPEGYYKALEELKASLSDLCGELATDQPAYTEKAKPMADAGPARFSLIAAYADALKSMGGKRDDLVVLDADLALDCGVMPFRAAYPERFVECGIAEMDMVSMAGGLALSGKLPVVHSFSCFLTTRANEQIFNNATECTKVVYVGMLAGLLPASPGHSHQSLRDIALMGNNPGMTVIQPAHPAEVDAALDWAVNKASGPTYLRIASMLSVIPYAIPEMSDFREGVGSVVAEGEDAVLFAYGPTMLEQACLAREELAARGIGLKVVNLPWLNRIAEDWLADVIAGVRHVFSLDDHMLQGGQGQMIAAALARCGLSLPVLGFGLDHKPCCGLPDEVLAHHGLNAASLADAMETSLSEV